MDALTLRSMAAALLQNSISLDQNKALSVPNLRAVYYFRTISLKLQVLRDLENRFQDHLSESRVLQGVRDLGEGLADAIQITNNQYEELKNMATQKAEAVEAGFNQTIDAFKEKKWNVELLRYRFDRGVEAYKERKVCIVCWGCEC